MNISKHLKRFFINFNYNINNTICYYYPIVSSEITKYFEFLKLYQFQNYETFPNIFIFFFTYIYI